MNGEPPATEAVDPRTCGLDTLATPALVALLAGEHVAAAAAVACESAAITRAVDGITERLRRGGTLHYVGAGTSGRLAMLDAAECPPTFGTPPSLVVAHVAGGETALTRAVEGAEDDAAAGFAELRGAARSSDAVVGISASGGTPYVVGALAAARECGALTIAVTSVAGSALALAVDIPVVVDTGPEPLAGSTRLKAGTAAKIVLNTFSTAAMVRLGRVHDNLMIDVVATNEKLRRRALRLVQRVAGVSGDEAAKLLSAASGRAKLAVVMARRNVDANHARALLEDSGGSLRPLL